MNKSESKYFMTAKRMDEAFLQILEKKDFEYITVKEVCNAAGVNRSTFYLHYETMNDLMEETVDSIYQQFIDHMSIDSHHFIEKIYNCPIDSLYLITPEYLEPYLNFIQENQRIFRVAFLKTNVLNMNDAYEDMLKYVFDPILDRYGVSEKERLYIMSFYVDGLMAIVKVWLKQGCQDSIDEILGLMQRCVMKPKGNI